jgi:thioesterase domain-containing protein
VRNVSQLRSAERGAFVRLKAKLVANLWAVARYAPQTYPGRVVLFLASESLAGSPRDPRLGWRELAAGGAKVHEIPGSHDAITRTHDAILEESHLQVLAEQLMACIDEALTDDYRS